MTPDELLSRLIDAISTLNAAAIELHDDPALAKNLHWRDNLETSGYQISTLLSTDD